MPSNAVPTSKGMPEIGMSPAAVRAVTKEGRSVQARSSFASDHAPFAPPCSPKLTLASFVMAEKNDWYAPLSKDWKTAGSRIWMTRLAWEGNGE
jgi:hypothetical protein